jgi:hypothetical protein
LLIPRESEFLTFSRWQPKNLSGKFMQNGPKLRKLALKALAFQEASISFSTLGSN